MTEQDNWRGQDKRTKTIGVFGDVALSVGVWFIVLVVGFALLVFIWPLLLVACIFIVLWTYVIRPLWRNWRLRRSA